MEKKTFKKVLQQWFLHEMIKKFEFNHRSGLKLLPINIRRLLSCFSWNFKKNWTRVLSSLVFCSYFRQSFCEENCALFIELIQSITRKKGKTGVKRPAFSKL